MMANSLSYFNIPIPDLLSKVGNLQKVNFFWLGALCVNLVALSWFIGAHGKILALGFDC